MIEEAVILAGGFGTRLQKVVKDVPKPMAAVNGKPFLEYIFKYLKKFNLKKVVVSVGYKADIITDYFKSSYEGIKIEYAFEYEPLGTGGGILNALKQCRNEDVLILNGDTFFNVDLFELDKFHKQKQSDVTLCLKHLQNASRYGHVSLNEENRIIGFAEKQPESKEGWINGGIYLLKKPVIEGLGLHDKFSFEKDFLERYYSSLHFGAYTSDGYFIDIGIPEDYQRVQVEISRVIN